MNPREDVQLIAAAVPDMGFHQTPEQLMDLGVFTIKARYWRAIHAEVNTHGGLNKNASSSRAIPVQRMIETVLEDTAGPQHWGLNQRGMQAEQENNERVVIPKYLWPAFSEWVDQSSNGCACVQDMQSVPNSDVVDVAREAAWQFSAWLACGMSKAFADAGYHKQITNRLTEPYQYITVVITGTMNMWRHFWWLRAHRAAMPEFRNVAIKSRTLILGCKPQMLKVGEWYIPFIKPEEQLLPADIKLKLSAARCAGTSYETVEGQPMTMDKALEVFGKLNLEHQGDDPPHASPSEHQARVGHWSEYDERFRSRLARPWLQYRKFLENRVLV